MDAGPVYAMVAFGGAGVGYLIGYVLGHSAGRLRELEDRILDELARENAAGCRPLPPRGGSVMTPPQNRRR